MEYDAYLQWLDSQKAGLLGDAAPQTEQALPDPNALYAQLKEGGAPSDYTRFAPGISADGLTPTAKAATDLINTKYNDAVITSAARSGPIGGVTGSHHMQKAAIDIAAAGQSPERQAEIMRAMRGAGATQLGYEGNHIHVGFGQGGAPAFGPDKRATSVNQVPPVQRAVLREMQNGAPLNQPNPTIAQLQATGSTGTPSGPAQPSPNTPVQGPQLPAGPNDPRNPGGDASKWQDPSAAASAAPAQTGSVGAPAAAGGQGKGNMMDALQKGLKGIMGLGALGAKGPLHYAPPPSGGSPMNRADVATPDVYKAGARILPRIGGRGLLG